MNNCRYCIDRIPHMRMIQEGSVTKFEPAKCKAKQADAQGGNNDNRDNRD